MGVSRYGIEYFPLQASSGVDTSIVSITGTGTDVITLEEAKLYMRVTNTREDDLITSMIDTSISEVERYLNSDILAKQRIMSLGYIDEPFKVYYAPIASIDSVVIDGETIAAGVDDGGYDLIGQNDPLIALPFLNAEKVVITYTTAGLQDNSHLNAKTIKQGLLSRIAWEYRSRDGMVKSDWKAKLSPYRRFAFHGTR